MIIRNNSRSEEYIRHTVKLYWLSLINIITEKKPIGIDNIKQPLTLLKKKKHNCVRDLNLPKKQ